jgi:hypothetical protein
MNVIKLFPSMESLVSDIPAGDGKSIIFFYSVVAPCLIAFAGSMGITRQ